MLFGAKYSVPALSLAIKNWVHCDQQYLLKFVLKYPGELIQNVLTYELVLVLDST